MPQKRLAWSGLYRESDLYKAAVRLYTKPLFNGNKALTTSTDEQTLFDFARKGLQNLHRLHGKLRRREFEFRPCLAVPRNFNGKHRTLYIYPWEERLVSLLLYRRMSQALDRRFSPHSYAYRQRGYGVDCCQRRIAAHLHRQSGPVYVIKRDITKFFDSIDHQVLLDKLREFVEPDDYLFELLSACVSFRYQLRGRVESAEKGVPFGSAVACLFANVYLMRLDARLAEIPGLAFFRYADDLLALADAPETLRRAALVFDDELSELKLSSKPSHHEDFVLAQPSDQEYDLPLRTRFRHLGLEYRGDGSIGLARDKFRKLRNLFRFAFRRNKSRIRQITDPEKRARVLAEIARETIDNGVRNVALIDYYLKHVNDESQLKRLDRWLAEEVLSLTFGGGHKKGYFRRIPFSRLRQMGLPSLVHRRRLILHGHLHSPFFIWKSDRLQRRNGGKAVRPKSDLAFSQSPEAATDASS